MGLLDNFSINEEEIKHSQLFDYALACQSIENLIVKKNPLFKATLNEFSHFKQLNQQERQNILNEQKKYLELCSSVLDRDNLNDKQILWRYFSAKSVYTSDDWLNLINDSDYVEVYDFNGKQKYRSFNFLTKCSYTLDELNCLPWTELFYRSGNFTQRILEIVNLYKEQHKKALFDHNIEDHWTNEVMSTNKKCFQLRYVCFAPLFEKQEVTGIISVTRLLAYK